MQIFDKKFVWCRNEHSRWLQALTPSTEDDEGEKIYEEWGQYLLYLIGLFYWFFLVDCPQITCRIPYQAIQPDEMTIEFGDVMKITKKTPDGRFLRFFLCFMILFGVIYK